MEYTYLPFTPKAASRLVYGTGNNVVTASDTAAAWECLDMAWEAGFRIFDTAFSYGNAEKNLGSWLESRGHRDELILLDKGCNPGQNGSNDIFCAETIRSQLHMSLERLRTDHAEMYILHRDDPTRPVDEIVEVLNELKAEGRIHAFGGSNWSLSRLKEANEYAAERHLEGFTVCSPHYALTPLHTDPWGGSVSIAGESGKPYREYLKRTGLPVFNYSSLGRGYLSGKYTAFGNRPIGECLPWAPVAEYHCPENERILQRAQTLAAEKGCSVSQLCLSYLLSQGLNLFPIVGPTKEQHLTDNVQALRVKISPEECRYLEG